MPFRSRRSLLTLAASAEASPRDVVDANLKLRGLCNAFVLTSGNFVTSGTANPTLLIVALAHRFAAHLADELRSDALGSLTTKVAL